MSTSENTSVYSTHQYDKSINYPNLNSNLILPEISPANLTRERHEVGIGTGALKGGPQQNFTGTAKISPALFIII